MVRGKYYLEIGGRGGIRMNLCRKNYCYSARIMHCYFNEF